jgi:GDP-D-mannose 3',5'-epimerase
MAIHRASRLLRHHAELSSHTRGHQGLLLTTFALQALTSDKEFEMWGDGKQTRSFTFIDDCVEGILRITKSNCR